MNRAQAVEQPDRPAALAARRPPPCASSRIRPSTAPTCSARCSTTPTATASRTRRARPPGRARRDGARPRRDDRSPTAASTSPARSLPREDRGSNFVAQARRPHAADRLPHDDAPDAGAARDARQGAALPLRRVDPSAWSASTSPIRCSSRTPPRCARSGSRGSRCCSKSCKKQPAILRLSYVADVEDAALVERRVRCGEAADRARRGRRSEAATSSTIETRGVLAPRRPAEAPPRRRARAGDRDVEAGPTSLLLVASLGSSAAWARASARSLPGAAAERQLPSDVPFTHWAQDPNELETRVGRSAREARGRRAAREDVKLKNVVPPIHFESGVANIPPSTVEKLRRVLDGMTHLQNVRLHLVGHADDQPLSSALAGVYGDNEGLSRERAGEVAEFIQSALAAAARGDRLRVGGRQPADRLERHARGAGAEPARRGRGLVRRARDPARDRGGRGPRRDQAPQGLSHRDGLQDALPRRPGAPRAGPEPDRAAPLWRRHRRACRTTSSARSADALHNLGDKQNVTVKLIGFTRRRAAHRSRSTASTAPISRCRRRTRTAWRSRSRTRCTCRARPSPAKAGARASPSRRTRASAAGPRTVASRSSSGTTTRCRSCPTSRSPVRTRPATRS